VDVIDVATRAQAAAGGRQPPIQVAVMGCVVNGPGEARSADIGIAAGRGKGHLFIKGQVVRVVPEAEMVEALLDEAQKLVEEGVEARLAAADTNAAAIAAADRLQLIEIKGDANLMSAIPLYDVDEVATKGDIAGLRAELKGDIAELRAELKGDIAEIRGDHLSLRGQLDAGLATLEAKFKSEFLKLALVLIAGFLGVIATLIGVGLSF
jgi:hypothetical protein